MIEKQIQDDLIQEIEQLIQNHPNFIIHKHEVNWCFDLRIKRGSSFLDFAMAYQFNDLEQIRIGAYANGWGYRETNFQLGDPDFMIQIIDWLIDFAAKDKKRKRRA